MSLMCNRIASSTSRCCIVLAKKQSTVSAPKSNLNTAHRTFYRRDFAWNEKRSLKSFCRSLAPSRAFDDDVDYLRCWNCNADFSHCVHSMIACSTCNAMRKPPPLEKIDYFDLYDFERSYEVDPKLLANKFKALQRLFHPDVFANRSEKEKMLSENWSSIINEAYATLLRPNLRANYLLHLSGKSIEEGEMTLEPEFLAEVMEFNEEISEAETRPEVESLMLRVKEVISEHERLTSTAFAKDDVTGARKIVAKMQYFINLKDKLIIKETDLGIMH